MCPVLRVWIGLETLSQPQEDDHSPPTTTRSGQLKQSDRAYTTSYGAQKMGEGVKSWQCNSL